MSNHTDRTWPLPQRSWVMRMTWSELLFAHWPVAAEVVAKRLPPAVQLDTWDGQAWVGVVPFLMSDVAPRGFPPIPKLSCFLELNVRTYVTVDGKPGVWFFSLDANSRVAVRVARATFNLPYMDAAMGLRTDRTGRIWYRSTRTHRGEPTAAFDADYQQDGPWFHAEAGSFEHWLTARYCLYSSNRKGDVFRGEIDHPPWQLASATYQQRVNTMGQPLGFALIGPPHLLCAQPLRVRAWNAVRRDHE